MCSGNHHVLNQINVLEGRYSLPIRGVDNNSISIQNLKERIIGKYY
jgi:hypothetical protein